MVPKTRLRAVAVVLSAVVLDSCTDLRPPTSLPPSGESSLAKSTTAVKATDLGTLGGVGSDAYGVNDAGQVVGASYDAAGVQRAFLWRNGVLAALEPVFSDAWAISNTVPAYIAGKRREPNDSVYAVRWVAGAPELTRVLDSLRSRALGINDAGTVVGVVCDSGCDGGTSTDHAAVWIVHPDRVERVRIHTPGYNQAQAYDINNAGYVAGLAWSRGSDTEPGRGFLRLLSGEVVYLPPLDGYAWSQAFALSEPNARNEVFVVGTSATPNEPWRATRWTVDLTTQTVVRTEAIIGSGDSVARGVHNAGHAAGALTNGDREEAFSWRGGGDPQMLPPLKGHGETWVFRMNRGTTRAGAPFYAVGESYKSGCGGVGCLNSRAVLWTIQ